MGQLKLSIEDILRRTLGFHQRTEKSLAQDAQKAGDSLNTAANRLLEEINQSKRIVSDGNPGARRDWKSLVIRASAALTVGLGVIGAGHAFSPHAEPEPTKAPYAHLLEKSEKSEHLADQLLAQQALKIKSHGIAPSDTSMPPSDDLTAKEAKDTLEKAPEADLTQEAPELTLPSGLAKDHVLSDAYIQRLKSSEGRELKAYPDQGGGKGKWTIGYGHTGFMPDGRPVQKGLIITDAEANALLLLDLEEHRNYVINVLGDQPVTQAQFEMLVDFSFNKGPENLESSNLLKKLKNGDIVSSANEYKRWIYAAQRDENGKEVLDANGKRVMIVMQGLVNRANENSALMLQGFSKKEISTIEHHRNQRERHETSVKGSENRLAPINVVSNPLRDAKTIDQSIKSLETHIGRLEKQIDHLSTDAKFAQDSKISRAKQYFETLSNAPKHVEINDAAHAAMDTGNQARVFEHLFKLRQTEIAVATYALKHYEDTAQALREVSSAMKDGTSALKDKNPESLYTAQDQIQKILDGFEGVRENLLLDKSPEGKALLGEKQFNLIESTLAAQLNRIDTRIAQHEGDTQDDGQTQTAQRTERMRAG